RKIQALGKQNPSLGEGESKPGEAKSKLLHFRESSISKELRRPLGHSAILSFSAVSGEIRSCGLRSYRGCAIVARAPGSQSGGRRRPAFSMQSDWRIEATMAE